jgi:hypothetical protein
MQSRSQGLLPLRKLVKKSMKPTIEERRMNRHLIVWLHK